MDNSPALRLDIDASACIGCERCVRICTSRIFYVDAPDARPAQKRIGLRDQNLCIRCGHCVAVCPVKAITHGDFPQNTVHAFNRALRPTPEQVMELIRTRRSNRAFSGAEVPEAALAQIIEAAHRAPTASNSQQMSIVQVHDQDVIRAISRLTVKTFIGVADKLEFPPVKALVKPFAPGLYKLFPKLRTFAAEMEKGQDFILRNAKEVLFFHTPKTNRFGCQDANLAYQNASLMAESLDVAHFYTGFVCAAFKQNPKPFLKLLGIEGRIQAGMALGMPDFRFERYIDRQPLDFKRI